MKITILASGSGGNASVYESRGTRIMIDAGVTMVALRAKLTDGMPDAIVITHAHGDHIGNCVALAKELRIPIWASESTSRVARLGDRRQVRVFGAREPFVIGSLTVSPTPLPHDAAQVGLVVSDGEHSGAIATDLGEVPPSLAAHFAPVDVLLLESNHDVEMLRNGPYTAFLKRRIESSSGHLSNVQTRDFLRQLSPRTHTVVLMHLSEKNNTPGIALACARDALGGRRVRLMAAKQDDRLVLDATAGFPLEYLARRTEIMLRRPHVRGSRLVNPAQLLLPLEGQLGTA